MVILLFFLGIGVISLAVYVRFLHLKLKEADRALHEVSSKNQELNTMIHGNELTTLRYKLNPHLFKNALNSIQSHAYQTYYSMDKLSGVLDYILYDSEQPLVSLKEEMDFAANFIEINRLKLSPLFDLRVRNSITTEFLEETTLKILPLITVDLIENAFKHGEFQKNDSFISIHFQVIDSTFTLEVTNRIAENEPLKKQRGGLGLKNMKESLSIAYPNAHQLTINQQDTVHHAQLKLNLNG